MKNLIVLTFGIALSSCSYSNNDFCECDYFKRDVDVEIFYDQKFIETATFKGKPLTGTVCDITEHFVHVEVLRHNHSTQVTQRKIVRRASRNLVKIGRGFDVRNFDLF